MILFSKSTLAELRKKINRENFLNILINRSKEERNKEITRMGLRGK